MPSELANEIKITLIQIITIIANYKYSLAKEFIDSEIVSLLLEQFSVK